MKPHLWPLLTIIVFGLIGIKALFHSGWYTSHDGEHQLVRQYIFDRAVKFGHIPPRVDRQLLNHLGYPLMTFTYQLPFIIGEPFRLLGLSIQDTVKLVFILTYIASGLTMYLFTQELWGRGAGLLAGLLYLWAPYRFSIIFVRASLGEHVAFVFLPLVLWSLNHKFLTRKRLIIGSLSLAGLVLSHLMAAQIFLPLIILYGLFQIISSKNKLLITMRYTLIAILGLSLISYYLLPAFIYRLTIRGLNRYFYAEHFATLKQLLYSRWDYGFSMSGPNDGMSFQLGLAHWLVIGLAIFLILKQILFKKFSLNNLAFIISFIFAIFMSLFISTHVWEYLISRYSWFIIDIPWRWLALATTAAAVLSGFVFNQLKGLVKLALVSLIILLMLYGNRNHLRVNEYVDYPDQKLTQYLGSSNSYDEYQSVYTQDFMIKGPTPQPVVIVSGTAQINLQKSLPHQLILEAQVQEATQIQINTVYFPGWTLTVDNQVQDIKSTLDYGVPTAKLKPGRHVISLIYRQTPVMTAGNIITLASLVILILLWKRNPKSS